MDLLQCPRCRMRVLPLADGRCPSCRQLIPGVQTSPGEGDEGVKELKKCPPAYEGNQPPEWIQEMKDVPGCREKPETYQAKTEGKELLGKSCFFCGRDGPCEAGFFRVGYVNYFIFYVTKRFLLVRCYCCPDCRRAFRNLGWSRLLIVLAMLSLPLMACLGIYAPMAADLRPGTPKAVTMAIGFLSGNLTPFF